VALTPFKHMTFCPYPTPHLPLPFMYKAVLIPSPAHNSMGSTYMAFYTFDLMPHFSCFWSSPESLEGRGRTSCPPHELPFSPCRLNCLPDLCLTWRRAHASSPPTIYRCRTLTLLPARYTAAGPVRLRGATHHAARCVPEHRHAASNISLGALAIHIVRALANNAWRYCSRHGTHLALCYTTDVTLSPPRSSSQPLR